MRGIRWKCLRCHRMFPTRAAWSLHAFRAQVSRTRSDNWLGDLDVMRVLASTTHRPVYSITLTTVIPVMRDC